MTKSISENGRIKKLIYVTEIKNALFIFGGVISATIGLKGFLLPNGFLDGGVTGISLLLSKMTQLDLAIFIIIINIPFVYLGIRQISYQFAVKTMIAVVLLALSVHMVEMPQITQDKLLIASFGGFFLGAGIGLAIRGGCVIDGTEVLAVYISRKSFLSVGDVISLFNILFFTIASFLTSLEVAMYSILTYLAASKTVDFIITGIEEYFGVTIVSEYADEIKSAIIKNLGMAVTVYKGEGGFGSHGFIDNDRKIIFAVVTRLEVQKLKVEIEKIDPNAFVIQHPVSDTKGGMIKKRPLH